MLAGAGDLLGVAIGLGSSWAASRLGFWETAIAWESALIGFAVYVPLGIIFRIYPAIRAAALQPIEARRAE